MTVSILDDNVCQLGEGALWHPERNQFFWFDILASQLLSIRDGERFVWQFDEQVSAAGWIGLDKLLIASETALFSFDLTREQRSDIVPLEAGNSITRSNDGRADPWGGFWIGTMGKNMEREAGSVYRYFAGQVALLFPGITVPNAICFSPDRKFAYFTDTLTRKVMRQPLNVEGWPDGRPEVWIDLSEDRLNPDGAVVDRNGCLWIAHWGAGQIARYSRDGAFLSAIKFPARQMTCPAFGGDGFSTLFATSAAHGLRDPDKSDGAVFTVRPGIAGLPEPRVLI